MIASSSAIRALFLATLAVASCRANEDSATLLRGNKHQHPQPQQRDLVEVDMNMPIGEMVCTERIPFDGSVVCTFRTMPPADMSSGNILYDCVYGTQSGSNYCLGTEVYRASYGDDLGKGNGNNPQSAQSAVGQPLQRPQQQQPQQQQQQQLVVNTGEAGKCPQAVQATGMACLQYIPAGSFEQSCYYGRNQCNCAKQDNLAQDIGWSCRPVPVNTPTISNPAVTVAPPQQVVQPVVEPVVQPVTNINANVNNQVVGRVEPSAGSFQIIYNNSVDCPEAKPSDGTSCDWGEQCMYPLVKNGVKVGDLQCDCNWNYVFHCRAPTHPIYAF